MCCCCLSDSHLSPSLSAGVSSYQVVVPEKVNAVLGKDITLSCRIEVGFNLSLIQSSWERCLPTGNINLAAFSSEFGISISRDYVKRVSFVSPSVEDVTITISGASFADIGPYICKVAAFPLGNTEASTYVDVLGKVELWHFLSHCTECFFMLFFSMSTCCIEVVYIHYLKAWRLIWDANQHSVRFF